MERVSWKDAREFIKRLNQKEGADKYRLPSEAEWEYASRAGTTTPFYTGNCISTDQANYRGSRPLKGCPKGEYRKRTVKAGSFSPNPWGLYDMHGNVWEWTNNRYGNYPSKHVTDPEGARSSRYHVVRGGAWISGGKRVRSAYRFKSGPATAGTLEETYDGIGLRVASSY